MVKNKLRYISVRIQLQDFPSKITISTHLLKQNQLHFQRKRKSEENQFTNIISKENEEIQDRYLLFPLPLIPT